jgi:hypothetical protein
LLAGSLEVTHGILNTAKAEGSPVAKEYELSRQDVVNNRPVYHPEKLRTLLELAKEAPLLEPTSPDLYQGYEERKVSNVSDYGEVVATVEQLHRFPGDDAIVLFGEIQNKRAHAVTFDPGAITIGIGDRQYPNAFVDCASSVEAGTTIKFGVIGQGDVDGGRAHLALRNAFRILLPNFREEAVRSPSPMLMPRLLANRMTVRHRPLVVSNKRKTAVRPRPSPAKASHGFLWPWQHAQVSPTPSPKPAPKKG